MSATSSNETFDDVVFEYRNKAYGAYFMRRFYGRSIIIATAIGIAFFLLLASIPAISAWITDTFTEKEAPKTDTKTTLAEIKAPEDLPPPPPPPPPMEAPKVAEIKFTEPEIVDEPVKDEDLPPPAENLTNANIGSENVEGEMDFTPPEDNSNNQVVEEEAPQIFQIVEQMPEFQGGEEALLKYLGKNIKYPEIARDANTQGTIFITFVVDENGRITSPQVLRGLNGPGAKECANEAMRVVSSMPAWKPGKQNGKSVKVQYNLPVKFTMR